MEDQDQQDRPVGLECPTCGCRDLRVWYTRARPKYILRVRLCRHCGRKITTREIVPTQKGNHDGLDRFAA